MAPIAKDVTFEVVGMNDDGTYNVRAVGGAGNPYAGGGSSPNLPAVIGGGYVALLNGRRVTFASEADAEVASAALSEMRGGAPVREINAGWSRGGVGGDMMSGGAGINGMLSIGGEGGNRGGGDNRGGDNQGPPDLEELWRDFNRRLSGMFGRNGQGGGSGGGDGGRQPGSGFGGVDRRKPRQAGAEEGGQTEAQACRQAAGGMFTGIDGHGGLPPRRGAKSACWQDRRHYRPTRLRVPTEGPVSGVGTDRAAAARFGRLSRRATPRAEPRGAARCRRRPGRSGDRRFPIGVALRRWPLG